MTHFEDGLALGALLMTATALPMRTIDAGGRSRPLTNLIPSFVLDELEHEEDEGLISSLVIAFDDDDLFYHEAGR